MKPSGMKDVMRTRRNITMLGFYVLCRRCDQQYDLELLDS